MERGELENYNVLDQIDFEPYIEKYRGKEIYELMDILEDDFNNTPLVTNNEYLEGCLFNWINEVELIDYLESRYSTFRIRESIKYYIV